jgi:exosome complex component RRP43
MEVDAAMFSEIYPVEFHRRFFEQKIRHDARALTARRTAVIARGSLQSADGSCMAKLGDTSVLCGLRLELKSAEVADAHVGAHEDLLVEVHLRNLVGRETLDRRAVESRENDLAQLLTQAVTSTDSFSTGLLAAQDGKYQWYIHADVVCLNDDGNLEDASLLALVGALQDLRVPTTSIDEESGEVTINTTSKGAPLEWNLLPVPVTFGFQDEYVVTDPSAAEEGILTSKVTVVLSSTDGNVCSLYKPGGKPVSAQVLKDCVENARKHVQPLLKLLQ